MWIVSALGVDKAEKEMAQTYEDQEYALLKLLVENGQNNLISTDDLAEKVPMPEPEAYGILRTFEDQGWVDLFETHTQIKHIGVAAFHKLDKQSKSSGTTSYVVHGNVGAIQHQSDNSVQFVQQTITQTSNPDFNEAINNILELIKNANIDDDDKESMANDVKAINNLALKEPKPGLLEKFTDRIKLLETGLKAADLIGKAAPYLPAIYAFFESHLK